MATHQDLFKASKKICSKLAALHSHEDCNQLLDDLLDMVDETQSQDEDDKIRRQKLLQWLDSINFA